MKDIRQTPQYANYLSKIGWIVETIDGINYFIKKIPFIGSVIKIQRPEKIQVSTITKLTKKYRAFQIICELKDKNQELRIKNQGFKLSKSPYLPTKTLYVNLTKTKEDLFRGLKKDSRYAIRKTQDEIRISYHVSRIVPVEEFRNAWKKTVGWRRYVPPIYHLNALKKSFNKNCLFYCSRTMKQEIEAGAIFLIGDKTAYYWQAFTSKEGRKNLSQYKIVWEGILWAKKQGAKIFDFEGIYDSRFPNNSWLGFTHFKKSFGGNEVEYPGAFSKFLLPFK